MKNKRRAMPYSSDTLQVGDTLLQYNYLISQGSSAKEALSQLLKERQNLPTFKLALQELLKIKGVQSIIKETPQLYLATVMDAIYHGRLSAMKPNSIQPYTKVIDWFIRHKQTKKLIAQAPACSHFTISAATPAVLGDMCVKQPLSLHAGIYPVFGDTSSTDREEPSSLLVFNPSNRVLRLISTSSSHYYPKDDRTCYEAGRYDLKRQIAYLSNRRNEVNGERLKLLFGTLTQLQGELILASQNVSNTSRCEVNAHFDSWYKQARLACSKIQKSWYFDRKRITPNSPVKQHIALL